MTIRMCFTWDVPVAISSNLAEPIQSLMCTAVWDEFAVTRLVALAELCTMEQSSAASLSSHSL